MKPKVVVYSGAPKDILAALKENYQVADCRNLYQTNYGGFLAELKDAVGLLGFGLRVDASLLRYAPHLKIVSNIAVGYDNLDIKAITMRGVMATNTPGVLTETTADLIFGLMLSAARRIPELDSYVKHGLWQQAVSSEWFGVDV